MEAAGAHGFDFSAQPEMAVRRRGSEQLSVKFFKQIFFPDSVRSGTEPIVMHKGEGGESAS